MAPPRPADPRPGASDRHQEANAPTATRRVFHVAAARPAHNSSLRGVFSAFGQPKVLVPYTADNTQGDAPAEGLNPLTNGQACFGPVLREGPSLRDGLRREVSYPHPGLSGGWNRPRTGIREQGWAGEALWSGGGNI